jgi:hypothetical protein
MRNGQMLGRAVVSRNCSRLFAAASTLPKARLSAGPAWADLTEGQRTQTDR